MDLSASLIELAKKRLEINGVNGDIRFMAGSAHNVPLPDESVDLVFGIAILHHLDLVAGGERGLSLVAQGRAGHFSGADTKLSDCANVEETGSVSGPGCVSPLNVR